MNAVTRTSVVFATSVSDPGGEFDWIPTLGASPADTLSARGEEADRPARRRDWRRSLASDRLPCASRKMVRHWALRWATFAVTHSYGYDTSVEDALALGVAVRAARAGGAGRSGPPRQARLRALEEPPRRRLWRRHRSPERHPRSPETRNARLRRARRRRSRRRTPAPGRRAPVDRRSDLRQPELRPGHPLLRRLNRPAHPGRDPRRRRLRPVPRRAVRRHAEHALHAQRQHHWRPADLRRLRRLRKSLGRHGLAARSGQVRPGDGDRQRHVAPGHQPERHGLARHSGCATWPPGAGTRTGRST